MTDAVTRIKEEMRKLPQDQLDELLRDIQSEYVLPSVAEDEGSTAAAWDEEINRRAQEVMDGTVELISRDELHQGLEEFLSGTVPLISAEESDQRIDALFARHGLKRSRRMSP